MNISFILGSGASRDFGYPLGDQLKQDIIASLGANTNGQTTKYYSDLRSAGNTSAEINRFADYLFHAERETIDEFIRAHKNELRLQEISREAIALSIANHENRKPMFNAEGLHWYQRLLKLLRDHPGIVLNKQFSFFTFNYDRSIEHYLHKALISGGEFSEEQADSFFNDNFIHIHGQVGLLPWQQPGLQVVHREYGTPVRPTDLKQLGQTVITPERNVALSDDHKKRLIDSDLIVFMGFGFAPSNWDKVILSDLINKKKPIFATTNNRSDLTDKLKTWKEIAVYPTDCNNFISQFIRDYESQKLPGSTKV